MNLLPQKYAEHIQGVLSCYDRVIIQGTLHPFCYPEGMTGFLKARNIRIFDYPKWACNLRDSLIKNTEQLAKDNNLKIDYIRKSNLRKEDIIKSILKFRGDKPGLVHIFSALESCPSYKPWHDKTTHQTFLKYNSGKCLHYYFYFIDEILGLCYVRVPTYAPFRLQIYFNGHNLLTFQLKKAGIKFNIIDNAFINIDDFEKAQNMASSIKIERLHRIFDKFANLYCPIIKKFALKYRWSIMQAEYATDIIFSERASLSKIYDPLIRTATHSVKPENIATFLGKKLHGNFAGEMGNNLQTRILGSRIKHVMGKNSIKMYDKFGTILRIETSSNDVSSFQHYRKVEKRDGKIAYKIARMKKGIYSLEPLRKILLSSNYRYLEFISAIEDNHAGIENLRRISERITEKDHTYRGFNFFDNKDEKIFLSVSKGEFNIYGFKNKDLRNFLNKEMGQISRILKRLRIYGLIKKAPSSYKYYLTELGKKVILTGLKLKELYIIPALSC